MKIPTAMLVDVLGARHVLWLKGVHIMINYLLRLCPKIVMVTQMLAYDYKL